jgi:hypothetical protein
MQMPWKERRMPYVTSIGQLAREEGLAKGLRQGMALLETKFKTVSPSMTKKLQAEREVERLQAILDAAKRADGIAEIRPMSAKRL